MSNYDDEERFIEQENQGQAIDPIGIAQDAMEINNRIQQSKMKNDSKGNIDVAPKTKPAADAASGAKGVSETGSAAAKAAGGNAASTVAAGSAGAAGAAGTAAATGTVTAATGTAATAFFATPAGWITIAVIVCIFLIIVVAAVINGTGSAMSEATGMDENLLVGNCPENDEDCKKVVEYLKGEGSGLKSAELFELMLNYCQKQQSFGEKLADIFNRLFTGEEKIENGCDLARVVNRNIEAKEKETDLQLSRGLVVSTLQWLYNSLSKIDDDPKNDEEKAKVSASHPNEILANIASSGIISDKDIKSLVDYMVFYSDYTYYEWKAKDPEYYDCKYDNSGSPYDCKIKITYECVSNPYDYKYQSLEKYFIFLRYGGTFKETINPITQEKEFRWNIASVENGKIIIKDHKNIDVSDINDVAVSYQEILNYNDSFGSTSEECKVPGAAASSLPKNTENITYVNDPNVEETVKIFEIGTIDTSAYYTTYEEITEPLEAPVIKTGCQFNNGKSPKECVIKDKLNYEKGFIFTSFPEYRYIAEKYGEFSEDIYKDYYSKLAISIEGKIQFIDEYEEYLNEIFGFDQYPYGEGEYIPGMFAGSGSSMSCLGQENLKIRLRTCSASSASKKIEMSRQFPGGASYINGNYVANDTISFDEYIKGSARAESEELFREEYLEALKFQLIAIKSYILSKNIGSTEEVYIDVGSACSQNYKSLNGLASRYKTILDKAYSEVKNILLYDGNNILRAEYGSNFTDNIKTLAKNGNSYEQILNNSYVRTYYKSGHNVKYYANAEFRGCSTTSELGNNFVQNAAIFLKGGSGPTGGWMNKNFINSQYKSTGDFQYGHAWCAKFVNLIKKLTPNVDTKIGNVPGFGAVSNWMKHFATQPQLSFCASDKYAHVGCYKGGRKYSQSPPYRPKAGDLIFYAYTSLNGVSQAPWNGNPLNTSNQDHIAIVANVYDQGGKTCIDTIEGNVGGQKSDGNSVRYYKCSYYTSHPSVVGYGIWE